jgi:hypothetical protein
LGKQTDKWGWSNQSHRDAERQTRRENNWRGNQQINQVTIGKTENTEVEEAKDETTESVNHAVNNIPTNSQSVSPYISCKIDGEEVQLLVDTGATVSVLTKEIVDLIIKRNPKVPILSVSGVRISNAVGKPICKVSKQILCECQVGEEIIYAGFIQIENLNEKGILGADILNQYDARINFNDKTIQWKMNKDIRPLRIRYRDHHIFILSFENIRLS